MNEKKAASQLRRWRENPAAFVHENFQVEPDRWQLEVLNVFPSQDADKRRISMQACAGPGKTAVLSWLGWNFLACYADQNEHPKGACVSVTRDNLRDNLWPEFSRWQQRSTYLKENFTWQKERIHCNAYPETWFLSARAYAKKANPEEQARTLSGLHAPFVLVLLDECGDIPVPVLRAGEQALGNTRWGKLAQAGNPTSLEGCLYHAATAARHLWYVVSITADPDDPNRTPRVDPEWAQEQIRLYGRENPWVMSYILGKFPPASINSIISLEEVEAAMNRTLPPEAYQWAQKRLGIDVARFGDDRTTICPRMGLVWFRPVIMRQADTMKIAARAAAAHAKWGSELILVDDSGHWGHGVCDSLTTARLPVIPLQYSGPAIDPRYYNKRCEMWMEGVEHIRSGACLPYIPELIPELTSVTYTFLNGKFLLEPKDLVKKRLGRSPDIADGYMNTYGLPDMPNNAERHMQQLLGANYAPHATSDFDPYRQMQQEASRGDFDPYRDSL